MFVPNQSPTPHVISLLLKFVGVFQNNLTLIFYIKKTLQDKIFELDSSNLLFVLIFLNSLYEGLVHQRVTRLIKTAWQSYLG